MGGWMKLGIHGANQTGKHYMVSDGKWRHLAVSMTPIGESSFSLNLFVDGRQETKFLSTINKDNFEINTQPSDLFVGGEGFSGWIDDLRIYSTRLNSGEITMILEEKIDDDLTITRGTTPSLLGSNQLICQKAIVSTSRMPVFSGETGLGMSASIPGLMT
jgi:hypothetical protein